MIRYIRERERNRKRGRVSECVLGWWWIKRENEKEKARVGRNVGDCSDPWRLFRKTKSCVAKLSFGSIDHSETFFERVGGGGMNMRFRIHKLTSVCVCVCQLVHSYKNMIETSVAKYNTIYLPHLTQKIYGYERRILISVGNLSGRGEEKF